MIYELLMHIQRWYALQSWITVEFSFVKLTDLLPSIIISISLYLIEENNRKQDLLFFRKTSFLQYITERIKEVKFADLFNVVEKIKDGVVLTEAEENKVVSFFHAKNFTGLVYDISNKHCLLALNKDGIEEACKELITIGDAVGAAKSSKENLELIVEFVSKIKYLIATIESFNKDWLSQRRKQCIKE